MRPTRRAKNGDASQRRRLFFPNNNSHPLRRVVCRLYQAAELHNGGITPYGSYTDFQSAVSFFVSLLRLDYHHSSLHLPELGLCLDPLLPQTAAETVCISQASAD